MTANYDLINRQLAALGETDKDPLALSANFVALLYDAMPDIYWLGIYVTRESDLVLGPFQGLPACVRIPFGDGVCGTAAQSGESLRIDDVHEFDGHIACDPASNSELVVPLMMDDAVIGVLDIDSPERGRFNADDQAGVETLCATFVALIRSAERGFI